MIYKIFISLVAMTVRNIFNLNIYLNIYEHLLIHLSPLIKCSLCCTLLTIVIDTVKCEDTTFYELC
jgi:hypothetical protein